MGIFKNNKQQHPSEESPSQGTQRQTQSRRPGSPVALDRVRHVVAVASGKGGVGKSTLASNLAVALQAEGNRVGLLDADIYGPSQPGMLGAPKAELEIVDEQLKPVRRHGIDFVSMGLLIGDDGPVVWRAPLATKMIMQFIGSVAWGELDYLLVDLPPGTGDVQLTLAQQASLSGAIIVTTPQDVALGVAKKGLKMFQQVNIPILGVVENMSGFTCSHCGQVTEIFKSGGGKHLAEEMSVPYLGSIPLDPEIVEAGESGAPVPLNGKESVAGKAFLALAAELKKQLSLAQSEEKNEPNQVVLTDSGDISVGWPDGLQGEFTAYDLRANCPCAACVDEDTGKRVLDTKLIPLDIKVDKAQAVGRYALSLEFSDGHTTGIYRYEKLREMAAKLNESGDRKPRSFDV